jgi:type 1 glutamine amidotransferase
MENLKTIKKTTTYTMAMYNKARAKAEYLGLTFHEYLKHLVANDIQKLDIPVYRIDDETAKDILKSYQEYKEGKYKTVDPSNEQQINEMLDIE